MTHPILRPARNVTGAIALALAMLCGLAEAHAETGHMTKTANLPHRAVPVKLDIYFPAQPGGAREIFGDNAVFTGIELAREARPVPGRHPVVLFSHGSGGNGINIGWFARALADRGMIVIIPNHPGSTSGDSDPETSLKIGLRAQDMSALIDQLPALFDGAMTADPQRIAAAGFSLGGHTALALAGARLSKDQLLSYCERQTNSGLNECGWFTGGGYDLNAIDRAGFERNHAEPRIRAVVSIDPGFAAAFDVQSLPAIDRPVQIINLGSEGDVPEGVDGSGLAAMIPGSDHVQVAEAWHFDFLGTCKTLAPLLLAATFDDPICSTRGRRSRQDIHDEIAASATAFLEKALAPAP